MNSGSSDKYPFSIDLVSKASFIIIVSTGLLELFFTEKVLLSSGYIIGVLLALLSRERSNVIIAVILALIFVGISFARVDDEMFKTVLITRAYALVGLSVSGYFILRFLRRETKTRNQQLLMSGIFSHGTQGIVLARLTGEIVMVNPFAEKMFGYEKDALLGTGIDRLIRPSTEDELQLQDRTTNSYRKESLGSDHNERKFPIEISVNQYDSAGQVYTITFVTDITIHKKNEEILLAQKKELEVVNQQLEAFSYSVSHDLRSPLRAVDGYARMLEEDFGAVLDVEGNRLLTNVQKSAQRMGSLIDDLLTFSRLGRKELKKAVVDMNKLANAALAEINLSFQNNATVTIHPLPQVMADASLLGHVVINLLSNAIKYSAKSASPQVDVSATTEDDSITVCIRDNGVGFDMNYVHKLFNVFQRLHLESEFEGTGVGLAIAQRIVQKHGGSIWATATEGAGASFYFRLPIEKF